MCGTAKQHPGCIAIIPADNETKDRPGPQLAKGNLRLAYMCQEASIGPTKLRFFIAGLGLRPVSRQRLQALAKLAADKTVKLNKADMAKWIETMEDVLTERGFVNTMQYKDETIQYNSQPIKVASHVRYDGCSLKSLVTPGPGATAGTLLAKELITGSEKVIDMVYESKRCHSGTLLQRKGKQNVRYCRKTSRLHSNHTG